MSRCWKAALPFLLAAVIILAAASRPVVLHIGFPECPGRELLYLY